MNKLSITKALELFVARLVRHIIEMAGILILVIVAVTIALYLGHYFDLIDDIRFIIAICSVLVGIIFMLRRTIIFSKKNNDQFFIDLEHMDK